MKDSELESITGIICLWLHWGDKYLKTEIKSTEKSQVLIVDMILQRTICMDMNGGTLLIYERIAKHRAAGPWDLTN